MRELRESDVTFSIRLETEHEDPEGFFASGDDDADRERCAEIRRQRENGNDWAWCTVIVTAEWEGVEASDSLGACSYESERDFKCDGYWPDMRRAALDALNAKITRRLAADAELRAALEALGD